jgi:hypothetical protein
MAPCFRFIPVQSLSVIFALLLAALAAGCVMQASRPRMDPSKVVDTTLMVARAGSEATLQWDTEPGTLYTVMYAPDRRAGVQWKPLPGAVRLEGHGQTIRLTDSVPVGINRHYRLHIEPLSSSR